MNIDQQVEILMQGTEYGDDELKQVMTRELKERLILAEKEGRPLRVYCGYDPRTTDLHIGHTVTMRKLRQFQEMGHEVTFLVGTYTSLIGDPSDKDKLRPQLTPEEVATNARTYAEQAFKILDPEKTIIRYNAEWLSKLNFAELIQLASNFTVQQFLARENFRNRFDKGEAIYLHEMFYTIMQGYDAHALNTDVQVGGTDQLFNIITGGRKIMSSFGQKPNIGIILSILPGTDGEIKMSKSLNNHIAIHAVPEDMFGKVMSIPDKAMPQYARLVTRWLPDEIAAFEKALVDGTMHPRDAKMKLAFEIVSIFYDTEEAEKAQQYFINLFQKGDVPEEMPEYNLQPDETLMDVLIAAQMVDSKSAVRRLMQQNGIKVDGNVVQDIYLPLKAEMIVQVGKRKFLRIV